MPSVQEVLRQTGFSENEIQQIDQRAVSAFSNVLSAAEQAREAAELAQRSNVEFYESTIVPSLNSWDAERQQIEAARAKAEQQANFYRAAAESAGILPASQPSDEGSGRYVAGSNGSPTFQPEEFIQRAGQGLAMLSDLQWRHQSLFNKPLPISPSQLIAEADRAGLDPATYADRKFGFAQREQELQKQRQEEHDSQIRQRAIEENDRKWAEKTGNNPDVRPAVPSQNVEISRAVQKGTRPDPLLLNDEQRHQTTKRQIRDRIATESD